MSLLWGIVVLVVVDAVAIGAMLLVRYVGDGGEIVAMNTFGASAPLKELVAKFGFTPDAVTEVARGVLR